MCGPVYRKGRSQSQSNTFRRTFREPGLPEDAVPKARTLARMDLPMGKPTCSPEIAMSARVTGQMDWTNSQGGQGESK